MTSGRFEFILSVEGNAIYQRECQRVLLPLTESLSPILWSNQPFSIEIHRGRSEGHCELLLGNDVMVKSLPGESTVRLSPDTYFDDYIGEGSIVFREEQPGGEMAEVYHLTVPIIPDKISLKMCERMIKDLVRIHRGFLFDFVSRSHLAVHEIPGSAHHKGPEAEVDRLESFVAELISGFKEIDLHPSWNLKLDHEIRPYRKGLDLDTSSIIWLTKHAPVTSGFDHRHAMPEQILTRVRTETLDIYEHRIIRRILMWVIDRLRLLKEQCDRIYDHLNMRRLAWDIQIEEGEKTVWEKDDLPRLKKIDELILRIDLLKRQIDQCIKRYPFLREASPCDLQCYPTPIFLNRPAYRQIYELMTNFLLEAQYILDDTRLKYGIKRLSALFEYWCFTKVVEVISDFLKKPPSTGSFKMTHDTYLPTPEPGHHFRFDLEDGRWLDVTFCKEFLPKNEALKKGTGYGRNQHSKLALRPDITIDLWRSRSVSPEVSMILDAKFSRHITPHHWKELSDYGRWIYEFKSGRQFIRQRWLLYPGEDANERVKCNIPEYLQQKVTGSDLMIDGSIPIVLDQETEKISSGLAQIIALWAKSVKIAEFSSRQALRGA